MLINKRGMTSAYTEHDLINQQLQSRLFQLPAELRLKVFGLLAAGPIVLLSLDDRGSYHDGRSSILQAMLTCRRAQNELQEAYKPNVHLVVCLFDGLKEQVSAFPPFVARSLRKVTVAAPTWSSRPDRFQWSADLPQTGGEPLNELFLAASNLERLIITVPGIHHPLLADTALNQMKVLRIRPQVAMEIQVGERRDNPNGGKMGPSEKCLEEVQKAIRGTDELES